MRDIKRIIIHQSASRFGDAALIDQWHKKRGFDCIGYHYVVLNDHPKSSHVNMGTDGQLQFGRPIQDIGAHCKGHNKDSIGICLISAGKVTKAQNKTLKHLVESLMVQYNISSDDVYGHYEFNPKKSCPGFDVDQWVERELKGDVEVEESDLMDKVEDMGAAIVELEYRVGLLEGA